ncbi:MAG: glycerol-3-phosphate acyltransferase [Dehalococcoidia bacterium]|nr:glycerol-3-phosphate acyltransferase [Dehalococcoidia bacterium]
MLTSAGVIAASYAVGSVPVAYVVGRARGVDIRERGSGNVGASNVWQSVSRTLVVPVGLAQIGQGSAGVLIARAAGEGTGVQVAAGLAAVVAHNWNPWLRCRGGRGVGPAIGVIGAVSPPALGSFIVIALGGVALRAVPQGVGAALAGAPVAAAVAGEPPAVSGGLALVAIFVLLKRLLGNDAPEPRYARPQVWLTRLLYDRDDRDRDAWVRRNLDASPRR